MQPKINLKPKGIIFDMDGVIFDSEAVWKQAFIVTNKKFGISLSEEYRQGCCGKAEKQIRSEMRDMNLGIDVDAYRDYIISSVSEAFNNNPVEIKPGFLELVKLLKELGIQLALATSSTCSRANILFRNNGLDVQSIFDTAIFADDVEHSKPNPEIFLKAAEGLRLESSECIVVEDSINGICAAISGGFIPVMVIDTIQPNSFVLNSDVAVFNSLNELIEVLVRK